MRLFLEAGYEKATMRKIAAAAGLAPGAAYYYFKTKEHIVFHFYEQSYDDHLNAVRDVLANETSLEKRIKGVITAHLDVARPYHDISKALFKVAAGDAKHPLSPFSNESKALREKNMEIFREVQAGAGKAVPNRIKDKLPELLWLYKVGIILYWVYDDTEGQERTYALVEKSAAIVVALVNLSKLPGAGTIFDKISNLVQTFRPY